MLLSCLSNLFRIQSNSYLSGKTAAVWHVIIWQIYEVQKTKNIADIQYLLLNIWYFLKIMEAMCTKSNTVKSVIPPMHVNMFIYQFQSLNRSMSLV